MPTLDIEEYQYSDSGVLLNGDANGLPFVDVESIQGLDSAPFRTQSHDREGLDGGYVDARFETIRTITIEGTVYTDPGATENFLDLLKVNFAPTNVSLPFYFQTDAGQRVHYGKSMGFNYTKDSGRRIGVTQFQIQIQCEDPRAYSPGIIQAQTNLTSITTSGRAFPKSYPILYGVSASNNSLSITIGGNRNTPGKLRIDGPVINPVIINDDTGTTMSFQHTLTASDYLIIDLGNKSVLMNGSTSVRSLMALTGNWFYLSPGINNFRFLGIQSPPTPLAKLTVSGSSAWR